MEPLTTRAADSLLRRLIFIEAPPSASGHIKGTETHSIVTALLRRGRFVTARACSQALLTSIGPTLHLRRDEWGIEGIQVYGPAPAERPVVFFMELTRRYRVTKWLCSVKAQPAPPPYTLSVCPRYDAILHIRLKGPVTQDAAVGIRTLLDSAEVFERSVLLGSGFQVLVYDSGLIPVTRVAIPARERHAGTDDPLCAGQD